MATEGSYHVEQESEEQYDENAGEGLEGEGDSAEQTYDESEAINSTNTSEQVNNSTASPSIEQSDDSKKMTEEVADSYSVFVSNIGLETVPSELVDVFSPCGELERITVLCYANGVSKGYAYVQFRSQEPVSEAVKLNGTIFKTKPLSVSTKRKNVHHFHEPAQDSYFYRGGGGYHRGGYSRGRSSRGRYRGRGRSRGRAVYY